MSPFLFSLVSKAAFLNLMMVPVASDGIAAQATELPSIARIDVANLQEQLSSVLRARRPEEFRFIANIVTMTQEGKLPLKVVLETFHYVRTKKKDEKFPFIIFERVLRIRAGQLGIGLPKV